MVLRLGESIFFNASGVLLYWFGGMHTFDAIVHGMTTIATAGFSNYDASFGHFADSPFLMITGTSWSPVLCPLFYIFVR